MHGMCKTTFYKVQYAIGGHRQSTYMNNIHVLRVRSLLTSNINFKLYNMEKPDLASIISFL